MDFLQIVLLIASAITFVSCQEAGKFADNLLACANANSDFNFCVRQTLEELRDVMPTGIPSLGLRPTEPLRINNIEFQSDTNGVVVDSKFTNVIVKGLSKFETLEVDADLRRRTMKIRLGVPVITITGFYKTTGKIFLVEIVGEGPFTTTLYGSEGIGFGRIVPTGPQNRQTLSVVDTNFDFKIQSADVNLENLFNGHKGLGDHVNNFLSDNSKIIIEKIKPQIISEVNTLVQSVLKDAFSKLPVEDFLNNLPGEAAVPRANRRRTF